MPTSIQSNTGTVAKTVPSALPKNKSTYSVTNTRNTAPRLMAQAEKNASQASAQAKTLLQNAPNLGARSSNKTTALNQSFAAKLTDSSSLPQNSAVMQSAAKTGSNVPSHSSNEVAPPKVSRVPTSVTQSSPVKHNRPEPTASAPPTMQHFQSPRKTPQVPATNQMTHSTMSTSDISGIGGSGDHARCATPIKKAASLLMAQIDDGHSISASIAAHLEYSLFNSGDQQPMWRRGDNEAQKPVNFAAATGNSNVQNVSSASKFIAQDLPPQVDAAKAPGYRGGSTSSPILSKNNSNSTTPPNISVPSFTQYHEPPKAQHMSHMTNPILRPQPSQTSHPVELQAGGGNYYGELFNQGVAVSGISNPVLAIGKEPHLIPSYNQPSTSVGRNQNYGQQTSQPVVTMSRLNPKAPDFSSSLYSVSGKLPHQQHQQQQAPLFGPYSMESSNHLHFVPKVDYRSNLVQTNQMPLMQMQQPLTPQQTEMISGMATGLTLHNIARATGSEILETPTDLSLMNNSPHMSPNMASLQSQESSYIDERKTVPPQPIGTERARRNYAAMDNNWLLGNEKNQNRWPGGHNLNRMNMGPVMDPTMADTYSVSSFFIILHSAFKKI